MSITTLYKCSVRFKKFDYLVLRDRVVLQLCFSKQVILFLISTHHLNLNLFIFTIFLLILFQLIIIIIKFYCYLFLKKLVEHNYLIYLKSINYLVLILVPLLTPFKLSLYILANLLTNLVNSKREM